MKTIKSLKNFEFSKTSVRSPFEFSASKHGICFIPSANDELVSILHNLSNGNTNLWLNSYETMYTPDSLMMAVNTKVKARFTKSARDLGKFLDDKEVTYGNVPKSVTACRQKNTMYLLNEVFSYAMPLLSTERSYVKQFWRFIYETLNESMNEFMEARHFHKRDKDAPNAYIYFDLVGKGYAHLDVQFIKEEDYGTTDIFKSFLYALKYDAEFLPIASKMNYDILVNGQNGIARFNLKELLEEDDEFTGADIYSKMITTLRFIYNPNGDPVPKATKANNMILQAMVEMPEVVQQEVADKLEDLPEELTEEEKMEHFVKAVEEAEMKGRERKEHPKAKQFLAKTRSKKILGTTYAEKIVNSESDSITKTKYPVETYTPINENSFTNFTKDYEETYKDRDMYELGESFANASVPLILVDLKKADVSDRMNEIERYTYTFRDVDGKQMTVSIDIPKVYKGNRIMLNGSEKTLEGQLTFLPIVKIGEKVIITTNQNKMFVEHLYGSSLTPQLNRISKALNKASSDKMFGDYIKYGDYSNMNTVFDCTLEFREMSRVMSYISNLSADEIEKGFMQFLGKKDKYFITFNGRYLNGIKDKDIKIVHIGFIDKYNIFMDLETDKFYYVMGGEKHVFDSIHELMLWIDQKTEIGFTHYIEDVKTIGKNKGTYGKILGKWIPLVYIMMYNIGLNSVLEKSNVDYEIIQKGEKVKNPRIDKFKFQKIEFADCYLILGIDSPDMATLYAPLNDLDTKSYEFTEILEKPTMALLLEEFGKSRNFPLYLDNFQDTMIDACTVDVLNKLKLPTEFNDILLYANMLITTSENKDPNDLSLYRYRTSEQVVGIATKELSDAYSEYAVKKKRGSRTAKVQLSNKSVVTSVMQLPNVSEYNKINPTNQLTKLGACSFKGHIGKNLARAYTLDGRKYHESHVGRLSIVSAYGASIGIGKNMVLDPRLSSCRGFFEDVDVNDLTFKELVGSSEAVTPNAINHDSAARVCMNGSQKGHQIGIFGVSPSYVTTGMDKVMPYMADDFCSVAEEKGVVLDVSSEQVTVKYDSGKIVMFPLNELNRNPSKGAYMKNDMVTPLVKGRKFKKNDIIAYNPQLFQYVAGEGLVSCTGTTVNVAFMSLPKTYEDAVLISESMSKKLSTKSVKRVAVRFNKNTSIIDFRSIPIEDSEFVLADDKILKYRLKTDDDLIDDFLQASASTELNTKYKKAKVTGELKDIRIYWEGDLDEADPSIKKMVNKINKVYRGRQGEHFNKTSPENQRRNDNTPLSVKEGTKINGEKIMKDEVMIEFYIEYLYKAAGGDKCTTTTALKGIISDVLPDDLMPVGVKTGRRADYVMSHFSPNARMTFSVMYAGVAGRILEWLKDEMNK